MITTLLRRWNLVVMGSVVAVLVFQSRQVTILRGERDKAMVRAGEQAAALASLDAALAVERDQARRNEAALTRRLAAEQERVRQLNEVLGRIARHEDRPLSDLLRETMP